ncbi:MAG: hypothetical protein KC729_14570, partial [Candidatus Eisenbacteria bacterium]|nr:hypothetical protein [Candidatus Eisenbacteria bacterium]
MTRALLLPGTVVLIVAVLALSSSSEVRSQGTDTCQATRRVAPEGTWIDTVPSVRTTLSSVDRPGWETVMSEGFEGGFPSTGWRLFPRVRTDLPGAPYQWDNEAFQPHSGTSAGWCAGFSLDAPTFPQLDPARDSYAAGMSSWMVYGPFDITDASASQVGFWRFVDSDVSDSLFVGASTDGINFLGYFYFGHGSTWESESLDIVDLIATAPEDAPKVWLAFAFFSDGAVQQGVGALIDDIELRKLIPGPGCGVSTDSLHFGTASIGSPVDLDFTIHNTGTETLEGTVTSACPAFTIVPPASYSLFPDGETTITVRFDPTTAGDFS